MKSVMANREIIPGLKCRICAGPVLAKDEFGHTSMATRRKFSCANFRADRPTGCGDLVTMQFNSRNIPSIATVQREIDSPAPATEVRYVSAH